MTTSDAIYTYRISGQLIQKEISICSADTFITHPKLRSTTVYRIKIHSLFILILFFLSKLKNDNNTLSESRMNKHNFHQTLDGPL